MGTMIIAMKDMITKLSAAEDVKVLQQKFQSLGEFFNMPI